MTSTQTTDLTNYAVELARRARQAGYLMAQTSGSTRDNALRRAAQLLRERCGQILEANALDMAAGQKAGLSKAVLDRLKLDEKRVAGIASDVEAIASQVDPVGQVIDGWVRPNGLRIEKVRVPIGSVLIIYEARPNVTSDAAALCIKSGNACILRGGKESLHSNMAIGQVFREAISEAGLPDAAVQVIETTDRGLVPILLKQNEYIDLVVPRGGESLIRAVVADSTIPVIKHYTGNCHVYVDAGTTEIAEKIRDVCVNAKAQRPGVCNAAESFLFHKDVADTLLPMVCSALIEKGVEIRGCDRTRALFPAAKPAGEEDWYKEYLDLIVAVKVVDSLEDAIDHINKYSSHHTDAILTLSVPAADKFVAAVDSASVMVNATTRLSDGGVYGLGAEVGISTDKLHARGPMGAADLTTYKYVVRGEWHLRT
jgi:glutamate-5-semialdehyde dehydrogenase